MVCYVMLLTCYVAYMLWYVCCLDVVMLCDMLCYVMCDMMGCSVM